MLPTTSSGVKPVNNGLSKLATVNYYVLATVLWCFLSVCAIVGGIYHCRANSYSYDIRCEAGLCVLSSTIAGVQTREINREDISEVRMVRLNKQGEVVDTNGMRHRQLSRLGSTVQFTFRSTDHDHATTETILFPPIDMGGNTRSAKSARRKIDDYITRHSDKPVKISNGRAVTVSGILAILGGLFSSVLSCMIGSWSDRKVQINSGRGAGFRGKRKD